MIIGGFKWPGMLSVVLSFTHKIPKLICLSCNIIAMNNRLPEDLFVFVCSRWPAMHNPSGGFHDLLGSQPCKSYREAARLRTISFRPVERTQGASLGSARGLHPTSSPLR